jgi:hypothetical protein
VVRGNIELVGGTENEQTLSLKGTHKEEGRLQPEIILGRID